MDCPLFAGQGYGTAFTIWGSCSFRLQALSLSTSYQLRAAGYGLLVPPSGCIPIFQLRAAGCELRFIGSAFRRSFCVGPTLQSAILASAGQRTCATHTELITPGIQPILFSRLYGKPHRQEKALFRPTQVIRAQGADSLFQPRPVQGGDLVTEGDAVGRQAAA